MTLGLLLAIAIVLGFTFEAGVLLSDLFRKDKPPHGYTPPDPDHWYHMGGGPGEV